MKNKGPKNLLNVERSVSTAHKEFMNRFRDKASSVIGASLLKNEIVRARIVHVANALARSGAVKKYDVQDIYFRGKFYVESVVLIPSIPAPNVAFINNGDSVKIISGLSSFNSAFFILGGDDLELDADIISFENVLDEDFDWEKFSLIALDYIHQVVFRRREVVDSTI